VITLSRAVARHVDNRGSIVSHWVGFRRRDTIGFETITPSGIDVLPKRQTRNAQGQIHAKLTFDRERLQGNRAMRTTDEHVGAQANP
jgi:hypothetical protein